MELNFSGAFINYIFIMPEVKDVQDQSPFQGFISPLVRNPSYPYLISRVSILPHSVDEIFLTKDELLEKRKETKDQSLMLLSPSAIITKPLLFKFPITVLAYDNAHQTFVGSILDKFAHSPITISNNESADYNFDNISDAFSLDRGLKEKLIKYESDIGGHDLEIFKRMEIRKTYHYGNIDFYSHGVVSPNELVLASLGVER